MKITSEKIDRVTKYAASPHKNCPEDGWWRPESDRDEPEKYFKEGAVFPLHKGKETPWRIVRR